MKPVDENANPQAVDGTSATIIWTYDVQWESSPIKWASRWDLYLKITETQIHWFSIINSMMIVFFLTGMVAMIMMRTLHRDLRRYNELDQMTEEEREEETGWKLVHGDVFRPPQHAGLLSILVGTGTQLFGMSTVTLIFAALGFLSPSNRGGLMTAFLVLFVFLGFLAGYTATRYHLMFKLEGWKAHCVRTAVLVPGVCFSVFFGLNLVLWVMKSTGAVPFGTLAALLALWFGISLPLTLLGGWAASKREVIENPTRVNNIPRVLTEEQPWYSNATMSVLVGGVLPFGSVFIEVFFIMSSVWMHKFYYVFGFIALVFLILIISCAEISIVMCYFQLCSTNYHWWWRSFFTAGSSAFYIFLYSIVYFATKMDITEVVPTILYFGYMFLSCFIAMVLTGTIGFVSSFWFVRKIYAAVKID
jgi:transmembrane 9 superfamily protein 2/4